MYKSLGSSNKRKKCWIKEKLINSEIICIFNIPLCMYVYENNTSKINLPKLIIENTQETQRKKQSETHTLWKFLFFCLILYSHPAVDLILYIETSVTHLDVMLNSSNVSSELLNLHIEITKGIFLFG